MRNKFLILMTAGLPLLSTACQKSSQGDTTINTEQGALVKYFQNPLVNGDHADPFVAQKDGNYYFLSTKGNRVAIAKTKAMSQLANAIETTVWTPPENTDHSADLWAPELHFLAGKWYIYVAAAQKGVDDSNRMFVLENENADPTQGMWNFKGKIADSGNDQWAIDGSVATIGNKNYFVWSGWENPTEKYKQYIYLAPMSNPWTISGPRIKISSPTNDWEKWEPTFLGAGVNEGPIMLQRDANSPVFIIFSASRYSSDNYCLAQIQLKTGSDPAIAENWINKKQVFVKSDKNSVYGPGHNGFFTSSFTDQNGMVKSENWFIYHARSTPNNPGQARTTRMQQLSWKADGSPDFGTAISTGINLPCPINEQ
ncbi:Beta-xylosidase, GH43 family [Pedobacter suwonensis]|uniref:Beta-xylosidase, GH43 family n=1 Tax=Pedobacter suwonensis TaxID=332999 RepID=A0A1I0TWZ4_9SPHI|nr:glycoside hydrolase family 43 protein [Pedobacter suwonensis]SFA55426.1 Beta-xylosidase, GH43 family [Pedobacter suwonensis]